MKVHELRHETTIDAPIEQVFDFFSDAENLQRLTPDALHFQIETPTPIEMRVGTLIWYRLKLMSVPFRWLTEITAWEPNRRFVDVQQKGPYRLWEHEHRFREDNGRTVMNDHLRYAVPGWFLEPLITKFFVKPKVEQIFDFRTQAIRKRFGQSRP